MLFARSMSMVAPVSFGVVHSVSLKVTARPSTRPLGITSSCARSGTVTVVHLPGVSGFGLLSELLWAASIQPRLTMPWSLSSVSFSTVK